MRTPHKGSQAHLHGSAAVLCLNPPVPWTDSPESERERDTRPEHRQLLLQCHGQYATGARKPSVCVPDREGEHPASPSRFRGTPFLDDHANPRRSRLPPSLVLFLSTDRRRHRCCCRRLEKRGRGRCPRAGPREDDKGKEVRARPREPALGERVGPRRARGPPGRPRSGPRRPLCQNHATGTQKEKPRRETTE